MSDRISLTKPIPAGYRIYFGNIAIAGVHYRKLQARAAARGRDLELRLEPEPLNKHDPNAIQVIAKYRGWFLSHSPMIGYIPKDLAADISLNGMLKLLLPRPKQLWIGDSGGIDFVIDLLGPKDKYKDYFYTQK